MNLTETRNGVSALEETLAELPQSEYSLEHLFADGLYCRKLLIPAGEMVVGQIHKKGCINIIAYGLVATTTDDEPMVFRGPWVFSGPAGTKRALVTIEDTLWITVHATNETEVDKAVADITVPDFEALT